MEQAVFLDRDGVIVEFVHLLHKPEQLRLVGGAAEAIRLFNNNLLKVIVISNQPVIARGMITKSQLKEIDKRLMKMLREEHAAIDKSYYCPHHPDANLAEYKKICSCRKPAPGLILKAANEFNIDLGNSWMVGDSPSDIAAGKSAGCRTIMVAGFKNSELIVGMESIKAANPDYKCKSLLEAAKIILRQGLSRQSY